MKLTTETNILTLPKGDIFSPDKTFNCGQCFRFEKEDGTWRGVVGNKLLAFPEKQPEGHIEVIGGEEDELEIFLNTKSSYREMSLSFFSHFPECEVLKDACNTALGIRILKQDFFETLISFIISQNNNIPRIKKNINSICERFGEKKKEKGRVFYTFPSPDAILDAGAAGLGECRLGFRTKYILDAARRVNNGEICEDELITLSDEDAKKKLVTIYGVGDKVASCVLLYGLGRHSAVPVDVWVKKIFKKYFDSDFVDLGEAGGVLQQYLFFHERFIVEGKKV